MKSEIQNRNRGETPKPEISGSRVKNGSERKVKIKILYLEGEEADRSAFLRMMRQKRLPWLVEVGETLAAARAHLSETPG